MVAQQRRHQGDQRHRPGRLVLAAVDRGSRAVGRRARDACGAHRARRRLPAGQPARRRAVRPAPDPVLQRPQADQRGDGVDGRRPATRARAAGGRAALRRADHACHGALDRRGARGDDPGRRGRRRGPRAYPPGRPDRDGQPARLHRLLPRLQAPARAHPDAHLCLRAHDRRGGRRRRRRAGAWRRAGQPERRRLVAPRLHRARAGHARPPAGQLVGPTRMRPP